MCSILENKQKHVHLMSNLTQETHLPLQRGGQRPSNCMCTFQLRLEAIRRAQSHIRPQYTGCPLSKTSANYF